MSAKLKKQFFVCFIVLSLLACGVQSIAMEIHMAKMDCSMSQTCSVCSVATEALATEALASNQMENPAEYNILSFSNHPESPYHPPK